MPNPIRDNLRAIRARLRAARARAGRADGAVDLVAVTKAVDAAACARLLALGQDQLGESRAQALVPKARWCAARGLHARWHFIGHLQRNKVRAVLEVASVIHSIDSLRLLETVDRVAGELGRRPEVFLEVESAGGAQRSGFDAAEIPAALARARELEHVLPVGLMTLAPTPDRVADPMAAARETFRALARLRDDLPAGPRPLRLSMGMSSDFELAVECGADLVRVGSALFAGCEPAELEGSHAAPEGIP